MRGGIGHTGISGNSANCTKSRTRPSTTTPFDPSCAIRAAMIPPTTALDWFGGWETTMMQEGESWSAKWRAGLGSRLRGGGGDFGRNRTVQARAMMGVVKEGDGLRRTVGEGGC